MTFNYEFVRRDAEGTPNVVATASVDGWRVKWDGPQAKRIRELLTTRPPLNGPRPFDVEDVAHIAWLPQMFSGSRFYVVPVGEVEVVKRGGPGSGNHGHGGLKGVHGGSSPRGGSTTALSDPRLEGFDLEALAAEHGNYETYSPENDRAYHAKKLLEEPKPEITDGSDEFWGRYEEFGLDPIHYRNGINPFGKDIQRYYENEIGNGVTAHFGPIPEMTDSVNGKMPKGFHLRNPEGTVLYVGFGSGGSSSNLLMSYIESTKPGSGMGIPFMNATKKLLDLYKGGKFEIYQITNFPFYEDHFPWLERHPRWTQVMEYVPDVRKLQDYEHHVERFLEADKELQAKEVVERGGPGSGNHGHGGLKGVHGGSSPAGGTATKTPSLSSGGLSPIEEAYGPNQSGVAFSYLVHIEGDGDGILKPDSYNNWYGGGDAEVVAYQTSELLGWGIVPETIKLDAGEYPVPEELPKEILNDTYHEDKLAESEASLQQWVKDAVVGHQISKIMRDDFDQQTWSRMALLDMLTGNQDRHSGNYLFKDGKLVAIDNGNAFRWTRYDRETVLDIWHESQRRWAEALGDVKLGFNPADVDAVIKLGQSGEYRMLIHEHFDGEVLKSLRRRVKALEYYRDNLVQGLSEDEIDALQGG